MHTGSAGAFDPARMMFPPEEKEMSSQETQNLYMTNVYRIQNLTEENYLYRQNFQFLTQMFEKQIHRKLYPQAERQVEKTIRQEMPKAEDRVIQEMTKELHTLVKESGVEQLRVLEKEAKEEQKVLLRKIENIYNSSVYMNVQAKNIRNNNVSINGRMENGQRAKGVSDRNTWLRTQIISVLEQKDQQTVRNLTEEILQKVKTKDTSAAIQQTERVYLEQVLEEYADGKTDRQQTVQYAAEIIERFERRGQTGRRVSEWITSGPSALQPMKVQQSEKVKSTQLLQWMELAAEGKVPMQLTEQARRVGIQSQMDAAPMEYLPAPETDTTTQSQIKSVGNREIQSQKSHVADETIRQKMDVAPMEHLITSEERAAQPQISPQSAVQSVKAQAARSQSQQIKVEQPQVWTTQTMMSLQRPTSSTSPAVKEMESHPAEELIRQRMEAVPMEHLPVSDESAVQSAQAVQPQILQSIAQSQVSKNQTAQGQSSQAKAEQPQVWIVQSLRASQHFTSPAAKAMESHSAEAVIRQRTEVTPMEHLPAPEESVGQRSETVSHPSEELIQQRTDAVSMEHLRMPESEAELKSQSSKAQVVQSQSSQPHVWTTQTMMSLQHQTSSTSPAAIQPQQRTPQRFTPVQMLPQQSSDMVEAIPSAQMFPQMQPPEVPKAANMRRSSRRQPMTMPHPQSYMLEAAPIIYAEEPKPATDPGETQVIRKQICEITEHIDEVKKTVAVERQVLTEQQKESIRQMIRSTPSLLTEGEMAVLMKQKVETEVSRKMDESMQQMTNRVYRRIEEKLKTERERRGRI